MTGDKRMHFAAVVAVSAAGQGAVAAVTSRWRLQNEIAGFIPKALPPSRDEHGHVQYREVADLVLGIAIG